MNIARHAESIGSLYDAYVDGDHQRAKGTGDFYDEYFAVMDLHADFYLETVDRVFQRQLLARNELTHRSRPVHPNLIRRTTLLTVEGELDDVCGIGQTMAAHDLCSGVRRHLHRHHLQTGVGHYGVFSGHRWLNEIYPVVREFILTSS